MKSNLYLRVVSALILAPVVLAGIFFGHPAFDVLMACMGALMAWEWEHMIRRKESFVAVALTLMASMVVFLGQSMPLLALLIVVLFALFLYVKTGKQLLLSFGAFYIGIPLLSMMFIAYFSDLGQGDSNYSYVYILWLLFVVWATDIGGYVVGKSVGGPKLAPKISPKKTWSGLLGGMLFSAMVSYLFVLSMNYYQGSTLSVKFLVVSSVVLAFVSQVGDIFESRIKRYLDIKDSSNLIPGHGGIFDRVDGLLFASPVVALFVLLMNWGILS